MIMIRVTIERNEDAFFAYTSDIDGCTVGGYTYDEVKLNMVYVVGLCIAEDIYLADKYAGEYSLQFELDLT